MKRKIILTGFIATAALSFALPVFAEAGALTKAETATEQVSASEAERATEQVSVSEAEPVSEQVSASEAGAVTEVERAAEAESEKESEMTEIDKDFYITEITDEIFDRMKGKSFKDPEGAL